MGDGGCKQDELIVAREPWRESVLRGMLTVAAIITPALSCPGAVHQAVAAFVARSPDHRLVRRRDPGAASGAGLTVRRRASAAIAVLFFTGVYVLSRAGFAAGVARHAGVDRA